VKIGSIWGFSFVSAVQVLGVTAFIVLENLNIFTYELKTASEIENLNFQSNIIKFNPISHIVLKYHSSGNQRLNEMINSYGFSFDLNESVVLLLVIAVLISIWGCNVIKKKEFISNNQEMEGQL
jgi:hypothetical protein